MTDQNYSVPLSTSEVKVILGQLQISISCLDDIFYKFGALSEENSKKLAIMKGVREKLIDYFRDELSSEQNSDSSCQDKSEEKDAEAQDGWRPFRDTDYLFAVLGCNGPMVLGHSLLIRNKESKKEYLVMICGYSKNEILLASFGSVSMHHAFKHFELFYKGCRQPFGVEQ